MQSPLKPSCAHLPGRRSAGSSALGRLVAATTKMWPDACCAPPDACLACTAGAFNAAVPSSRVSSWPTMRASCCREASLRGQSASICKQVQSCCFGARMRGWLAWQQQHSSSPRPDGAGPRLASSKKITTDRPERASRVAAANASRSRRSDSPGKQQWAQWSTGRSSCTHRAAHHPLHSTANL